MPQASTNSSIDMENALLGMAILLKSNLQLREQSFFD